MVRVLKRASNHHITTILSVCHKANSSAADNCTESSNVVKTALLLPPQTVETVVTVFTRTCFIFVPPHPGDKIQCQDCFRYINLRTVPYPALLDSTKSCKQYISCSPQAWSLTMLQYNNVQHDLLTGNHCSPHSWQQIFCKQQVSTMFCLYLAPRNFASNEISGIDTCFSPCLEILSPISLTDVDRKIVQIPLRLPHAWFQASKFQTVCPCLSLILGPRKNMWAVKSTSLLLDGLANSNPSFLCSFIFLTCWAPLSLSWVPFLPESRDLRQLKEFKQILRTDIAPLFLVFPWIYPEIGLLVFSDWHITYTARTSVTRTRTPSILKPKEIAQ